VDIDVAAFVGGFTAAPARGGGFGGEISESCRFVDDFPSRQSRVVAQASGVRACVMKD